MLVFLGGLVMFFGAHLFSALMRGPRQAIITQLGEVPYKGFYAIVSLVGFILIVRGWPEADRTVLYTLPAWTRTISYLLMPVAFIAIVSAYLPAGKIAATLKHPMLVSVKLWALLHLLTNGDVRSVMLFGAFLAYGVIDRIALKKRGDNGRPAGPVLWDGVAIAVGIAAYVGVLLWLHPYMAGVALT